MALSRKTQISLIDTPYYHCISRCVRRAFLCGEDQLTGKSYEHRREWVEHKLLSLGQIFAIEVCAYAVMSNHFHLVLFVDVASALDWSEQEVAERWHRLFKGTLLTQQFVKDAGNLSEAEALTVRATLVEYRKRLMDISWFMRVLNEDIARQGNKEDKCTGRFWEGRFKSQALLDEAALMACMAYVDLNPIRAGIAKTPEQSNFTSIKRRIQQLLTSQKDSAQDNPVNINAQPSDLVPFVGNPTLDMPKGLPFVLADYIELVELTGRCLREDKLGHIHQRQLPILTRLGICPENWLEMSRRFTVVFHGAVGHEHLLSAYCEHLKLKRRSTLNSCERLLA